MRGVLDMFTRLLAFSKPVAKPPPTIERVEVISYIDRTTYVPTTTTVSVTPAPLVVTATPFADPAATPRTAATDAVAGASHHAFDDLQTAAEFSLLQRDALSCAEDTIVHAMYIAGQVVQEVLDLLGSLRAPSEAELWFWLHWFVNVMSFFLGMSFAHFVIRDGGVLVTFVIVNIRRHLSDGGHRMWLLFWAGVYYTTTDIGIMHLATAQLWTWESGLYPDAVRRWALETVIDNWPTVGTVWDAIWREIRPGCVASGHIILRRLGWLFDRLPAAVEAILDVLEFIAAFFVRSWIGATYAVRWAKALFWLLVRLATWIRTCIATSEYIRQSRQMYCLRRMERSGMLSDMEYPRWAMLATYSLEQIVELSHRCDFLKHTLVLFINGLVRELGEKGVAYRASILALVEENNRLRAYIDTMLNFQHAKNKRLEVSSTEPFKSARLQFLPEADRQTGFHFGYYQQAGLVSFLDAHNEQRAVRGPSGARQRRWEANEAILKNHCVDPFMDGLGYAFMSTFPGIRIPAFGDHRRPFNITVTEPMSLATQVAKYGKAVEDFGAEGQLEQWPIHYNEIEKRKRAEDARRPKMQQPPRFEW